MKMELGEYGMNTYLLRLVACLFLCVSLNTFGATIYSFVSNHNNGQEYLASINPADNQVNIAHTNLGGSEMLLGGLAFGDGLIYSFVSNHNNGQEYLASINPADNQVNIISHTNLGGSEMLLGGLAAVPLPAGIYLFLSGLVGLGLMRGRNA